MSTQDLKTKLDLLIEKRFGQLEEVRPFVSLKIYNTLKDKLEQEKIRIDGGVEAKQNEQQKMNLPQAMPKAFFELKRLPKKPIRID